VFDCSLADARFACPAHGSMIIGEVDWLAGGIGLSEVSDSRGARGEGSSVA
jgi:hypothetical protein